MNLHAIVSPAIALINPFQTVTIRAATGYATNADGTRTPSYAAPVTVQAQKQDLSQKDIEHMSALNIQGQLSKFYMNGTLAGLVRVDQKGGDLITDATGRVWLVVSVPEDWSDNSGWVAVIAALQNGA